VKHVLVAIAAVAAAAVGWVLFANRTVEAPVASASIAPAAQLARGAMLARAGNCATCHTARGGPAYAGGRPIATPFGTVYAGNLTPDAETGIGAWTAAEFRRALYDGRSRDGRLLYPAFPYTHYTQVTPEDADALHAFLRSVPPVRLANRPHALRWPYSTQAALAVWRALYFERGMHRDDPARTAAWNRGAYLVRGLGHCSACHAARDALGGTSDMLDLSGGLIPMQNWYAPSLASPAEAGLMDWSLDEIVRLLRDGVAPRGSVAGPMAEVVLHSTQYLEPADLQAMAVFLKELPVVGTPVPEAPPAAPGALLDRGGRLYGEHCAQCHGERGEGVPDAYPPLAGNRAVGLPVTANLVQMVLYGGYAPATQGNPRPFGMPPYATVLGDADVAAVLSYIRGSWGNRWAPVGEFEVATQRTAVR
jgi:mono/diheme cytochrome c family protein